MTQTPHQRFVFDTVFDGEGAVIASAPRPRRLIPAEEVEAIRKDAFLQGERSAVARAEAATAQALQAIAGDVTGALGTLAAVAHQHRVGSAELALAAAGKIAGAAMDSFPEAAAAAALKALAREVEAAPRLIVHVEGELVERLQGALDQTAHAVGYPGQITVKAGPGLQRAAFVFDWGEGRAVFDPQAATVRVGDALHAALAADGLHAEPLLPAEPTFQEGPRHD